MDFFLLNEEYIIVLIILWVSVSDIKKGVELMYFNKVILVVVFFNRRSE